MDQKDDRGKIATILGMAVKELIKPNAIGVCHSQLILIFLPSIKPINQDYILNCIHPVFPCFLPLCIYITVTSLPCPKSLLTAVFSDGFVSYCIDSSQYSHFCNLIEYTYLPCVSSVHDTNVSHAYISGWVLQWYTLILLLFFCSKSYITFAALCVTYF